MSWLTNLKETGKSRAGDHPNAQSAYDKSAVPAPTTTRPREGSGSLDLGNFALVLEADRQTGEPLVEVPVRALVGKDPVRMQMRFPRELERYLYSHTKGAMGSAVVALVVHGLKQLQESGQKLVLTEEGPEEKAPTQPAEETNAGETPVSE